MGKDAEDCPTELLRELRAERSRADWLMALLHQQGSALARIEQRCIGIEERLGQRLTSAQWAKIIGGLALPLAVLLLTGNVELARKLIAP